MEEARIYVSTYAKHNNSSYDGGWIDLRDISTYEEFIDLCRGTCSNEKDPEFMFIDWENIPNRWVSQSELNPEFFKLRDIQRNLEGREYGAFGVWLEKKEGLKVSKGAETLLRQFEDEYVGGGYYDEEDFAEQLVREEEHLSEFVLSYFNFEKYAEELFRYDYWYSDGYVFSLD